jgi:hypothetical protein
MGILDEIKEAQRKPVGKCSFGQFIETLSKDDQAGLAKALADRSITTQAIFIAVRKNNFMKGETVIRKHRRGDCACR